MGQMSEFDHAGGIRPVFMVVTEWCDGTGRGRGTFTACEIVSVSYTHLDVYKRQHKRRLPMTPMRKPRALGWRPEVAA